MIGFCRRFLLGALSCAVAGGEVFNDADGGVKLSLSEFKDLFRQARMNKEDQELEARRTKLKADFDSDQEKKQKESSAERRLQRWRALGAQTNSDGVPSSATWVLVKHTGSGKYKPSESFAAGDASGSSEDVSAVGHLGMAEFGFSLQFHVFESMWTAIPLIDGQAIVKDWQITRLATPAPVQEAGGAKANSTAAKRPVAVDKWEHVDLGPEMLLMLQDRVESDGKKKKGGRSVHEDLDNDEENSIEKQDYTLVTNTAGTYQIRFKVMSWVQNSRNLLGVSLNLLYPLSSISVTLEKPKDTVMRQLSVEPPAATELVEASDRMLLNIQMPATKRLTLQWRMASKSSLSGKSGASAKKSAAKGLDAEPEESNDEPQVVVQHDVLHSIGESVVVSDNMLKFSMDSEERALGSVSLLLPSAARVTSVVAHGMLTWRSEPYTVQNKTKSATPVQNVVTVVLKSSTVTKEVVVLVTTELELAADSALELPLVHCQKVLRQTGTVAVVKDASVEVHEHAVKGVTRAAPSDIPQHMLAKTHLPVVHAFRFLSSRHSVVMSLVHHEELRTLESVVDMALYEVLVLEAQKMHALTMILQNTQQQYMMLRDIPKSAQIWSLKVNSLSAQPVRRSGNEALLMVPLLVGARQASSGEGGDSIDANGMTTSVELSWMTEHSDLGKNGTVSLTPPRVDMPVSALQVDVQFPEHLEANFTGALKQVNAFSLPSPNGVSYEMGKKVVKKGHKFASGSSGVRKTSVQTKVPAGGKHYRFEKILVVTDGAALEVKYEPKKDKTLASEMGLLGTFASKTFNFLQDIWSRAQEDGKGKGAEM